MNKNPTQQASLWRILDAASNRAAEGLRVAEDFVRFALDDAHLTREWKSLRHDLAGLVSRLDSACRHGSRSTRLDVGTEQTLSTEAHRDSLPAVFAASVARAQQALRSLEEYGKLIDAALAGDFESLRYRSYTLSAAVVTTEESCRRLESARLYVIVDGRSSTQEFAQLVETIYTAGTAIVQLRDKQLSDRELVDRARGLVSISRRYGKLAIVNDRADIAAAVEADGVHLGQEELSVKDARHVLGPKALIGVSTHSIEQAREAVLDGANYLGVGPTFPSQTKTFRDFPGLEYVWQVAQEISLPAFVIGGVTLEKLPEIQAAGLRRVAVSGAVLSAEDPAAAAEQFSTALGSDAAAAADS